jgi:HK97 family phage prohead protease
VKHKTISDARVEVKSASRGEVTAVFATFNVIDHDGDVTLPGAFTDGERVKISAYNHESWKGALPVGRGVIRQTATEARLEGRFFLNTQAGRETFEVVKELEDLGEWSYGYDVVDAEAGEWQGQRVQLLRKLKVHEVSPVLLGAGIDTRTLAVKSASLADREAIYRRSLASISKASIALAGLALHDHTEMNPNTERLLAARNMADRLWRLEVKSRVG